jgi:hypothetical protein
MKRHKALTQVRCPGYFRVAWSFFCTGDLFFLYVNFEKKHHIHERTIQKPLDQLRCKFDFVQLERVFFANEKA